jgi:hypothetical protein
VLPAVPDVPPAPRAVMVTTLDVPPVVVPKEQPLRSESYRRWAESDATRSMTC